MILYFTLCTEYLTIIVKYYAGYSRTINEKDRLEYDIVELHRAHYIAIARCTGHYDDK